MKVYKGLFAGLIEPENLFFAWDEFKRGKTSKLDVQLFEKNLEENIFQLHCDLQEKIYRHGPYESFFIYDPKRRHIHKATVRDRVLHHALFQVLNPVFEPTFIANSFSCRIGKGTHKGVEALEKMLRKVSKNYTHPCYTLKCDIKKFFDSVDHQIVLDILEKRIEDLELRLLLREVVGSYPHPSGITREREREREYWRFAPTRNTHRQSDLPDFRQCVYERI
jgi:retron-type reverse transcriptase